MSSLYESRHPPKGNALSEVRSGHSALVSFEWKLIRVHGSESVSGSIRSPGAAAEES